MTITNLTLYRQGDVMLERISEFPPGLDKYQPENGRYVLALGEVTGHAHAIYEPNKCTFFKDPREEGADVGLFFEVGGGGTALKHEEHAPIDIPEGKYRVIRQREWDDGQERRVYD